MICWKVWLAGSISLLDLYLWNGISVFTLTITDANYFHYSSVTFSHCFPTTMWQTFPTSRTIWNNMTGIMFLPQWWKENDSIQLSSSGIWIALGIYKVSPGARQSHRYFKKLKFQIKFQILNFHVNLCPKFNLSVNIPESRGIFFSLSLFTVFLLPLELPSLELSFSFFLNLTMMHCHKEEESLTFKQRDISIYWCWVLERELL